MNGDLALEVQTSIFALLKTDPVLISQSYLNGPNVFDHIPDNSPPNFICLDDTEWGDGGDKTDPGQQGMFYVRCWTREKGNKTALLIARRVVALLHEQSLILQSGYVTVLRLASSGIRRDPDGVSQQAYRVFRIITSE